ncbi:alpha/beta hydrolase [Rhodococcus sp. 14-2470-1b]|uniref:DUF4180 domain-containing protein n=1 Tax=Rhodococcus sp. 14-2470-1b TaxID=2023149 RepID=UPI000B9A3F4E|nr:DUF4180 domain-containing protein [Rhodococcus sp. 14-2470-1b]OZF54628.1 alpha/beta hydrolase [Rhodococcus sp. 14-2470-1b]
MNVLYVPAAGDPIGTEQDALDIVGDAFGIEARVAVVPVQRLMPEFFDLSTRLAGEFVQKLVNYRIQLVIEGDIQPYTQVSEPLRAFVAESNRGRHIWFVPNRLSLQDRIATIR